VVGSKAKLTSSVQVTPVAVAVIVVISFATKLTSVASVANIGQRNGSSAQSNEPKKESTNAPAG